jgi:hypothetical protein
MDPTRDDVWLADAAEAAAMLDLYAAAPPEVTAGLGLRVLDEGTRALLAARHLPDPVLNRAIGLGNVREASESDVDAIVRWFAATGVSRYWIHVGPQARPSEAAIVGWLRGRGFAPPARRTWAKMLARAAPPPAAPARCALRPARVAEAEAVAATICAAYGMPGAMAPWFAALVGRDRWRTFVAVDGDEIVGAGMLFVDRHLRAGWLGLGGLRASHRRLGAHRALMTARMQAALGEGCDAVVTETGEPIADEPNPSLRNMQRCGFARVASRGNYASPAPAPGTAV